MSKATKIVLGTVAVSATIAFLLVAQIVLA